MSRSTRHRLTLLLASAFALAFHPAAPAQTIAEYQRQASELERGYRFPEAVELLEMALRQYPSDLGLLKHLGALLVRMGQATEGERLLREALSRHPHQLEVFDALARAELRQGRFRSAIALLEDVVWHRPEDAQAQHRLAHALFLNGEFQGALERARCAVELEPSDFDARRLYSLLLDVQGSKDESYRQLKATHQLAPQNASVLFQLSEKERRIGRLREAFESLRRACELDPENPLYHSSLSQLYDQMGQKALSAQEAEKARQLAEAFDAYAAALDLKAKGQDRSAASLLEPFVQRHPEFATGALLLASLYSKMGRLQQALDLYFRVAEEHPTRTVAREEAAWILAQTGDPQAALKVLGELAGNASGRFLLEAYSRAQTGDYPSALKALRRAQVENPLNPELLLWIAHCLQAVGQSEEALELLGQVRKLRPEDSAVPERIRQMAIERQRQKIGELSQAGQWKEALRELTALLTTTEPDPSSLFQKAYSHQQLGQLQEALHHYRIGLQREPGASWARQNLAGILYQLGRYSEAAREWEQIPAALRPPEVWQQLGFCYAHLRRYQAAERSLQTALKSGMATPQLLYHLAVAQMNQGKEPDEAWRLIRRSAAANYRPAKELLKQAGLSR